jgi:hypothetical protein
MAWLQHLRNDVMPKTFKALKKRAVVALGLAFFCDLEYYPTAFAVFPVALLELAPELCRAVQVAGRIEDQASVGKPSILATEGVKHSLSPFAIFIWNELEYDATVPRRSVQVPSRVEDQTSVGE